MTWSEDAEQMAAEVHEAFAREVMYTDQDTEPTVVDCTVGAERIDRQRNNYGGIDAVSLRDIIKGDADGTDIRLDGVFTIDGMTYSIESEHPRIGGRTKYVLKRTMPIEKTRRRYRG